MGRATSAKPNGFRRLAEAVRNTGPDADDKAVDYLADALRESVTGFLAEALRPVGKAINTILEVQKNQESAIKVLDDRLAEVPSKQQIDTLLEKMDRDNEASKDRDKKMDEMLLMLHKGETSGPVQ